MGRFFSRPQNEFLPTFLIFGGRLDDWVFGEVRRVAAGCVWNTSCRPETAGQLLRDHSLLHLPAQKPPPENFSPRPPPLLPENSPRKPLPPGHRHYSPRPPPLLPVSNPINHRIVPFLPFLPNVIPFEQRDPISPARTDGVRGCLVVHTREGVCEYSPVLTQA